METVRANLPTRLRRFISKRSAGAPKIRVHLETPPKIKAFIAKVIESPLPDIAKPLSGFKWEYNKGDFHHWAPLFLHFDAYFTTYLASRSDLLLSDNILDDVNPFPKDDVLHILRVMQIILENCHNRSSFSGLEHLKLLLSSTDPEVLIATLETLSALVNIRASKLHGGEKLTKCGSLNSCLLSLSQGWGSKDEGLGLFSCVTENERIQEEGTSLFPSDTESVQEKVQFQRRSTLYFELHKASSPQIEETTNIEKLASSSIINIQDLHLRKEDDLLLMKECIEHYNVPLELRFSLLTRIRYAHSSRSPRTCRMYARICLLAFVVLVQSSDAHQYLTSFFDNEPEYTNELIKLVQFEPAVPCTIRTAAMHALGSQLAAYSLSRENGRVLRGSNISAGSRAILLNVLQRAALPLKNSNDSSSVVFVEAVLQFFLIHVISSANSGVAIRGSGIVSTFLPLLDDSNPVHLPLVSIAVKTLQKLMDYSHTAVTLFIDSGGPEILSTRLQIEVHRVIGLDAEDDTLSVVGECSGHNDCRFYSQKMFIRNLLKALGSATYSPANSNRSPSSDNSLLATLSLLFGNASKFGGDIYSSAVTLMNEIIHRDPTCFNILHECGLPDAFLSSVSSGVLPSSKALICVPHGLSALCLNAKGLEVVKATSALQFLVEIFTSKKYAVAVNEGIVPLTNAVEELLRHVPSLRSSGVDIVLEIIKRSSFIADENHEGSSEKDNGGVAMEMDSEHNGSGSSLVAVQTDSAAKDISDEQFIQLCIFDVMVLVHRVTENTEMGRLFVEKSGIEALLKLLLRSSITEPSEGMSIALYSTKVFKVFSQLHSVPLAQALCSSLRDHLKKALLGFSTFPGSFLLDPKTTPNGVVFSSLSIVDFILLLTASKDTRCASALLTEFGNDSKDVLEDIGRLHREVLWQVCLLEDNNRHVDDDNSNYKAESRGVLLDTNETEEPRVASSLSELTDPLLRSRTAGPNVESQFSELLNLYHDFNHTTGLRQRLGTGNLDLRFESASQLHQSGSSEAAGALSQNDDDKHRLYYSSCCYTLRALALHITHLFQELGKAMLVPLPSHRRENFLTVSASSISVVSSIASITHDHINFKGHANPSTSEVAVSTKCRYLGKVVDFIDHIFLEKPDSCNPVVLNCLFGRGVVQSVLTTFQATSELMFTVNSRENDDASLKEEDRAETDHSWIYGTLASYGKLMEHLVTSSLILSRPTAKHLLVKPVPDGITHFPRDGDAFVKVLQSIVLKAVIPVWNHPQFTNCEYKFITTLISINRHVYSGLEVGKVPDPSTSVTDPPNETSISAIVEMGFSRSRAEEALTQVGLQSVELAMEWLFTHPEEETHEDDELARALAISLGQPASDSKDVLETDTSCHVEEETVQLPPVEDVLSTCIQLMQMKESLAFPVWDLLVTLCSQNDGQYRPTIVNYIIDLIKQCSSTYSSMETAKLSALFHVLALILHEDKVAREIAFENGLVKIASELLSQWDCSYIWENPQVPNWVKTAFLAIDCLLHVDLKLDSEIIELLKKVDVNSNPASINIDEDKQRKLQCTFGLSPKFIDMGEQKKLIEIACSCIKKQLPSETTHAVLQLCATLTRTHSVALNFSDAGCLPSLLSLPASSMFSGFDDIATTIICHILEDPQTLQQAMESEIRHSIVTAGQSKLTPNQFVRKLTTVISRDPVIFIRAAQSVCQVEMTGEVPHITLLKDKNKEKEGRQLEKDKSLAADEKVIVGSSSSSRGGYGKLTDLGIKSAKIHRKPPQSFVNVIEFLLDAVVTFVPPSTNASVKILVDDPRSVTDMDIDAATIISKGKAVATSPKESEAINAENSLSLAKTVFILKLLKEILLMYGSTIHILLGRDSEISSCRGVPQRVPTGYYTGGIFHHILNKFLSCSQTCKKDKKVDGDWSHKLASKSSQFLVASCVRSSEARKRVFTGIKYVFSDFVDSSIGFMPPRGDIIAFLNLLNEVLSARSPAGSYICAEASALFVEIGLVKSLTRVFEVLDLDHTDSSKAVTTLVKVLDMVTKEHVHSVDSNTVKSDNVAKLEDHEQSGRVNNIGDEILPMEIASQPTQDSLAADNIVSLSTVHSYDGPEDVTDDMHHNEELDGGYAPTTEGDYMQDSSEDTRDIENGLDSVRMHFEIQPHTQENLVDEDDDEEMSGDDGDEVDEDEDEYEENNDFVGDEVHNLAHADLDEDDHDIDEDEEDEEMLEEEDEGEDGVLFRLDDSIGGINVFDHIEVLARDNSFPDATLRTAMPVEIIRSRRQGGQTTSTSRFLGRVGDSVSQSRHPLLVRPTPVGQTGNSRDVLFSYQNSESTTSRLDSMFNSLRNGRHGTQFTLREDASQQTSASSASVVSQIEELLLSRLRCPVAERAADQMTAGEPQTEGDISQLEGSEAAHKEEAPALNSYSEERGRVTSPSSEGMVDRSDTDITPTASESLQPIDGSQIRSQSVEMQFEHSECDTIVQDMNIGNNENGAPLGDSHLFLEGQDDGEERPGPAEVFSLGNISHAEQARRANATVGNSVAPSGEDPLHSAAAVTENHIQEADQGVVEGQPINGDVDARTIDPAFLNALPEELRAEVLSAQQGQVSQPTPAEPQSTPDIDPEFLAALPPDIRAEVLAQQETQRRHRESESRAVEMDADSIIATFPSDIREEVLLTSSDAILSSLAPALVAEANMLRERLANQYNRTLFSMPPRNHRGGTSRHGEGTRFSFERAILRRSIGSKLVEADGEPLVDAEGLRAMLRLLRVVQPLYRGPWQRFLLNLCAYSEIRSDLIRTLMGMLVLDEKMSMNQIESSKPQYHLYACQSNVMYSRPQFFDGIPPLVSRRILDILIYLAQNHPSVAKILLQSRLAQSQIQTAENLDQARGKAAMDPELNAKEQNQQHQDGYLAIVLLLRLLSQPLYMRSTGHLEQLLNLLAVIIDNAEKKSSSSTRVTTSPPEQSSGPQTITSGTEASTESNGMSLAAGNVSSNADQSCIPSTSSVELECDTYSLLVSLPQAELRLLSSLLAREGLSDNVYTLVAEVLRKLVAVVPSHCHLCIIELADAVQKLMESAIQELHLFGETGKKTFQGITSCDGPSILRVLMALSSLVASMTENKDKQSFAEAEHAACLAQISSINATLEPLWHELSTCITRVESCSESTSDLSTASVTTKFTLPAGSRNLLPYIESFFVVCEKLHFGQSTSSVDVAVANVEDVQTSGSVCRVDENKDVAFEKFSESHKKILNAFIRQKPGLLEKSFSLMLKVPRFIDFDNKRAHFKSKIKHQHDRQRHNSLKISVRRAYILEDSYNQLRVRSAQDLRGRLTVQFQGEEGIDAGGLSREWYQLLSRFIFDKGTLLFTTVGNDSTFQPNPNSVYQAEHLSYFKFVGRVVGKALLDGQLLDMHFTRSFYKHILGVKVGYHDIEAIDPDYFKNLKWMLENDISDVLDLTFSVDADEEKRILYEKTEVTDYELIPGGRNIKVTEENKHKYVDLIAENRLTTAIRPQINAFLEGFIELISRDLISIFNDKELELLISGLPDIDLDDMRVNTEYSGYSAASPVIQWFWEVVQGFSKEDKARLLQFITGTSKVPLEGFRALQGISGAQKFQIHKAYGSIDHLPSAHTCFNQLDLPEYPSKHHLEERLLLAIHEANEGFGFG